MTEPELDPARIEDLRREIAGEPAPAPTTQPDPSPAPMPVPADSQEPSQAALAVAKARGVAGRIRRVLGRLRRRGGLLARGYDPEVVGRMSVDLEVGMRNLEALFEQLKAEVRALAAWVGAEDPRNLGQQVDALSTNLDLLKAELRGTELKLGELGQAIAPGAGLGAAAPRLAEMRERLNAVDRRVRQMSATAASAPPAAPPAGADTTPASAPTPAPAPQQGSGFDYVGFEQRFRGDSEVVLAMSRERYLDRLKGNQPVLDVGCGRGELLRMLADHGVEGSGVDLDGGMVAEAIASGVDAHHGDAIEFLRNQPEGTYGAITAIHVVEHLPLDALIEFLELAATRLKPGGILIAETPNPATLLVLGNSYILDPTHVWPLHPSLLSFMCERAGFRDVELVYGSPAEDYHLALLADEGPTADVAAALNPSLQKLNEVLFGPQEYAVVARTPDS